MSLTIPVAFMIFNRPDLTQRVFEVIAKAKPEQLLVVADGPRFAEDAEKCAQARAVIEHVDWACDVLKNYAETNLGCGRRISSGIDWVFSQVEEAIILEDDTLPAESFFSYCRELLDRYRHDKRIMTINGNNFQFGRSRTEFSYHFSKYCACWGWASWRRAWQHYDFEMKTWPAFKRAGMLSMVCEDPYEHKFWMKLFDAMYENPAKIDTWDHQWNYACWSQNGLEIEPSVNLVANIGLGRSDASHTTGENLLLAELSKTKELYRIEHPPFVVKNTEADAYIFDYVIGGNRMKREDTLPGRLVRRLSAMQERIKVALQ